MPTTACSLVAVDVAIDRFVTDVQLVRDLLWTLIKHQMVLRAVPGHLRDGQTIALTSSAPDGSLLGEFGFIAAAPAVVGDLAIYRAFTVANTLRNRT